MTCDGGLFFTCSHNTSPSLSSDEDEDGDSITVRNDDELAAMLQYVRALCCHHVNVMSQPSCQYHVTSVMLLSCQCYVTTDTFSTKSGCFIL